LIVLLAELIGKAQRGPVSIEKYGRPVAAIMSSEEYRQIKLERLRVRGGSVG